MKGQIHPEDSRHITTGIQANDFLTFDPTRTHLVRAVEVKGKHLIVRRFDKKSVEWRTKLEKLDRNAGIVLSPEEAEKGFPGCLAAWGRVAQSSLPRSGSKVFATNVAKRCIAYGHATHVSVGVRFCRGLQDDGQNHCRPDGQVC